MGPYDRLKMLHSLLYLCATVEEEWVLYCGTTLDDTVVEEEWVVYCLVHCGCDVLIGSCTPALFNCGDHIPLPPQLAIGHRSRRCRSRRGRSHLLRGHLLRHQGSFTAVPQRAGPVAEKCVVTFFSKPSLFEEQIVIYFFWFFPQICKKLFNFSTDSFP